MMVTLTNRGAALARIELSDPKYRDIDIRSGYLGHILTDPQTKAAGCPVQLVGQGTPAEKAGLKVGDLIVGAAGQSIKSPGDLKKALGGVKPGRTIELNILRGGKPEKLSATLTRYPMEVIRPPYPLEMMPPPEEGPLRLNTDDPLSLLMTMQQIDDRKIPDDADILKAIEEAEKGKKLTDSEKTSLTDKINKENLDLEMKGIALRRRHLGKSRSRPGACCLREKIAQIRSGSPKDLPLEKGARGFVGRSQRQSLSSGVGNQDRQSKR